MRTRRLLFGIVTALLCGLTPESDLRAQVRIGQPFRIYPSAVTQTEPLIIRHPTNTNMLFATATTINLATAFISEGVYVSTDAGTTWRGSDTCNGQLLTAHRGDPGIAIDQNGRFVLTRLGSTPGLYSHSSTDNGRTWSSQRTISTNDQDRATLTSDGNPPSTFYGRCYAVWVRLALPFPVFFSSTTDGGTSWSAPSQINSPFQRSQGAEIAMGPSGRVSVCWAGVLGSSPFTEDFVGFATSTNAGASWTTTENAFDVNGIQGLMPQKSNIRVNGLPKIDVDKSNGARSGWTYVVTTQRNLSPAGSDPDILLHRSTNNGQTWSGGIRVNGDLLNNSKIQFFPAIHVDDGGGVNILYYDDRNTTADSATVYLSRSTDGGNSWADYRVSNRNFKPTPIGGLGQGYQGDNISMTSLGNTLWAVWMDNSSGIYQIWACPIDINALDVRELDGDPPEEFELMQNYPNPFNPATNVELRIAKLTHVKLNIFDALGNEIASLLNETLSPGSYSVAWNAASHPSGIYFCRLRAGNFSMTRKLLLLR